MATAPAIRASETSLHNHIPSLDGWRGLAILLVLFEHAQNRLYGHDVWDGGQHGVTIFFVLSGFLITTNLLKEPINLRRFYVRRFFWLIPTAWSYIAFVLFCDVLFRVKMTTWSEVLSCVTFWRNYYGLGRSLALGHFWSLSIEEQFYLFWPGLLLLAGKRHVKLLAIALICGFWLWRLIHWNSYLTVTYGYLHTPVHADSLLFGCLLAILWREDWLIHALDRHSIVLSAVSFCGLLYCFVFFRYPPPLAEPICIAVLIGLSVRFPQSKSFGWINSRVLSYIGIVSYSIYVWQQYFFEVSRPLKSMIVMMCLMPFFAGFSFYVIERPLRRFGRRLASIETSSLTPETLPVR